MRTLSRKSFAIGLLVALLVTITGRAVPVSALAQPEIIPELAPVFDTEIIQLQDYIENNVTPPQFEIFNILLGLYVASQGGFSEYKLHDPYANQDGILAWLKSCGIQLYNSLIGMGSIGPDPMTGIDYRPFIKGAMDIAMGCAVKSTQYQDTADFVSDVNVQEKYFIPMDFGIQGALNYIFSKSGGMYEWQFDVGEFVSTVPFNQTIIPQTSPYWTFYGALNVPKVRVNTTTGYNTDYVIYSPTFAQYTNLFLNTVDNKYYFYDDNGNYLTSNFISFDYVNMFHGEVRHGNVSQVEFISSAFYPTLSTYPEIIQSLLDTPNQFVPSYTGLSIIYINDFVVHYYYGTSWDNKNEIFHTTNLNLDPNTLPYYQQIANDYLLDVKGILAALLNETDLTNVILNNIYDLDAVKVEDPKLILITTEILEEIQVLNPPLPVNMNDIEQYTDNTYLERVKEHARNASDIFANYVAFWHNCDSDLVYTIFGAGILVLVAAFIGKWGHS